LLEVTINYTSAVFFRKSLKSCFEEMGCFLMPHPGKAIRSKAFTGATQDIEPEFITHLKVRISTFPYPFIFFDNLFFDQL
jgi:hypothetical protein